MFKAFFTAAAFVLASSPAFVSAQDFFFSFDEFSRVPTATTGVGAVTGSVFLFADENVDFNSADIDFTNSDSSVVAFTSGTAFDTVGNKFLAPPAIDSPSDPNGPSATDGRYFAASALELGIDPANAATDPEFRAGANGFLLARVDYDIIGPGTANFDLIRGGLGIVNIVAGGVAEQIPATFGSASVTVVAVPEPSSAILLILGAAGMVARRSRS